MFQIQPSAQGDEPCLRIEGELTIYSVAEARDQLGAALDRHPVLRLNLAAVEELDSAGVQLLVWIKQEARRRGRELALTGHSPAVVEVFDLLQVAGLFGDAILLAPSVH